MQTEFRQIEFFIPWQCLYGIWSRDAGTCKAVGLQVEGFSRAGREAWGTVTVASSPEGKKTSEPVGWQVTGRRFTRRMCASRIVADHGDLTDHNGGPLPCVRACHWN
jgi:hypothetical protein